MTVPRAKRSEIDHSLCVRCQESTPVVTVRKDSLCKPCFDKYVSNKIAKRMDTFRVRYAGPGQEVTLMLALSCGPSSTTMLHLLDKHLQRQQDQSGRVGFKLHGVHFVGLDESTEMSDIYDEIKTKYPGHTFSSLKLSDVTITPDVLKLLKPNVLPEERSGSAAEFLNNLTSRSSRSDMARILMRRSLVDFAKQQDGHAILWGDSTTTLAGRTLAETAKGRGSGLPWIAGDGDAVHGLPFYFPVRDLLTKEVVEYLSLQEPPVPFAPDDSTKATVSTKNTSIDELTKQYFNSADKDYPSIVANVVRTTDKLSRDIMAALFQCEFCDMPLGADAPAKSRLCNGCIRSLSQTTT